MSFAAAKLPFVISHNRPEAAIEVEHWKQTPAKNTSMLIRYLVLGGCHCENNMQYVDAFRRYGASLRNPQWSVSAENLKGELVVSLWEQYFFKAGGSTIRYIDKVSRWSGTGNAEFQKNIDRAYETAQVLRAVIARTDNSAAVDRGEDASKLKNTFSVKEDWFGKVVVWDGDNFEIEFERR